MNKNDKSDLDLDATRLVNYLERIDSTESVFYARSEDKDVFYTFFGKGDDLVKLFITTMVNEEGFYEIVCRALDSYEEQFPVAMNVDDAVDILTQHNKWRRGANMPQIDPASIGDAIDVLLKNYKR